jgi:hypothetical protein
MSKSLLAAIAVCLVFAGLCFGQSAFVGPNTLGPNTDIPRLGPGIYVPHPYMEYAVIEHHGGTATVRADFGRPLYQAMNAVGGEYGWGAISYEDPPYESNYDLQDMTNPVYRAGHPDAPIRRGPAGRAFESTYPEDPHMWSRRDREAEVLTQIITDYNKSGNPGHFVLRALPNGSYAAVGDGIHDANGTVIPVTPFLDTPISLPAGTRSRSETVAAIMKAAGVKRGMTTGGMTMGPQSAYEDQITLGGGPEMAARELLMQVFPGQRWVTYYSTNVQGFAMPQYTIGF